jgi:hypothetical protein
LRLLVLVLLLLLLLLLVLLLLLLLLLVLLLVVVLVVVLVVQYNSESRNQVWQGVNEHVNAGPNEVARFKGASTRCLPVQ